MTNKSALIVGQIRTCDISKGKRERERESKRAWKLETRFNWSRSVDWSIENGSNDFPEFSKPAACHANLRGNESKPIIIANCLILALKSECRVISSRKQEVAGIRDYQPRQVGMCVWRNPEECNCVCYEATSTAKISETICNPRSA